MNLQEIDLEIKNLYKKRDKEIEKEYGKLVGKSFHPPGIDIFILVTKIKGRDVSIIEIVNGDVINSTRNYEDQIFSEQYEATKAQFKERLKQIYNQHLMQLE